MEKFKLIATTTFGLEAIARRELENLGYEILKVTDGKIYFEGDLSDIAKANIWLRTADRVLILLDQFEARTFEELFDKVYEIDWVNIIPKNGNFIVNGKSIKSKLYSVPDCQRITEKAIIEKLKTKYDIQWFEKSGALYELEVSLLKDVASITLDTTGKGLHKRGYRIKHGDAPLKETLAAALVSLSFWNEDRLLFDPFCGTGTILIEAAMIGKNIAPGLKRGFSFNNWTGVDKEILNRQREIARSKIKDNTLELVGTEIDKEVAEIAEEIIKEMNLQEDIAIYNMDFRDFSLKDNYGILITNPPYGERLTNFDVKNLEKDLAKKMKKFPTWSKYVLTSDEEFEKNVGKKADRRRKLYNGRLKVDYYQYYGPRPK